MTLARLRRSLGSRPALALPAGLALAFGQAPFGLWWLALPGLVALVALVARADSRREAALVALFGAAAHFAFALSWIVEPFFIDAARHGWMAPFALPMIAFGMGLFWMVAGWVSGFFEGPRRALAFATALAAMELARGYVLTGFPWALVGHIWVGAWPAQVASLIGPSGLTLLTVLAAALPVAFRGAGLAAGGGLLAAAAAFGLWQLNAPEPPAPGLTLRLVQPNAEQKLKWDPQLAAAHFGRLLDLTRAGETRPDLVIWPETAVPYLLDDAPGLLTEIAAAGQGTPVALGIQRAEGWRFWNSLAVIAPDARVVGLYDKHHLAPFGEYVPMGDLLFRHFGIRAFAAQEGFGYSAGPGPMVLDLGPLGRVLPLICYEAVFPQDLRTDERPDWLLQITNDAWFGTFNGPYQHLAQTRLRAIEMGLPLVRVANTGVSALIDARGRVLAELPLGEVGYKDVALPGSLPPTPFSQLGEMPVLFALAALCGFLLLPAARRRA